MLVIGPAPTFEHLNYDFWQLPDLLKQHYLL